MKKEEIAMQITLKAMELNRIPYTAIASSSDLGKENEVNEYNAMQIADFYHKFLEKLSSDT